MMYHALFITLFRVIKHNDKRKRFPDIAHAISVIFFISAHISINILVISLNIQKKIHFPITQYSNYWFILIVIFNLFYFLWKKRYLTIEKIFLQKNKSIKLISYISTVFYIILTITTYILFS